MRMYIALRDKRRKLAQYEKELDSKQDEVGAEMLAFLDQTGQEAARTVLGTVTRRVRDSASLPDPDAFMEFVIHNNAHELMDRRANGTACKHFANVHGHLPPGVKISSIRYVSVRAATDKGED